MPHREENAASSSPSSAPVGVLKEQDSDVCVSPQSYLGMSSAVSPTSTPRCTCLFLFIFFSFSQYLAERFQLDRDEAALLLRKMRLSVVSKLPIPLAILRCSDRTANNLHFELLDSSDVVTNSRRCFSCLNSTACRCHIASHPCKQEERPRFSTWKWPGDEAVSRAFKNSSTIWETF